MKKSLIIILIIFIHLSSYGQTDNDLSQAYYYQAYTALQNMLEGKDSLDYEKAVFICENAYHDNYFKYEDFKNLLDFHTDMITAFADNIRGIYKDKYAALKDYEKRMFNPNINNYAIFKYISDTAFVIINNEKYYKTPYNYTAYDPYGSDNWENTQVMSLLMGNKKQGNCYSLAVLFKLFADRLQSDARLTVTPHHIYIQNRNHRGGFCNIELASKKFPGDGSIQTLTYTTTTAVKNGMAQRMLSNKEAVALNLIYLAKGYQHKYNDNTNDFMLQCAELAFKHDSLSMNALLLKAEITENRLLASMKANKIKTLSKARANNQTKLLLANYEKQLSKLYILGYREIPKEIERVILAKIQNREEGSILKDHTPNPFADIKAKTRYITLSNGIFDEIHEAVDSIQYYHALLNTKTKKIIKLLPIETDNEYKVDPVIFALSVDPLSDKYPSISPYAYCAWNPVMLVDPDGRNYDEFGVDKNGNIKFLKFKDGPDELYKIDKNNNKVDVDKNGKIEEGTDFIKLDKEVVKNYKHQEQTYNSWETGKETSVRDFTETKNDVVADRLFNFLSKNTDVEWSITKMNNSDGTNTNLIVTSHLDWTVSDRNLIEGFQNNGWNVNVHNHNHPNGDKTFSANDLEFGRFIQNKSPNAKFNIFTKPNKFTPYTIPKR